MTAGTKKVVTWLVIAFVAFYLVTRPDSAADAVRGAGSLISDGFQAVITFLSSVFA